MILHTNAPASLPTAGGLAQRSDPMDKPDDIPYGYCRCGCGNRTGHLEPVTHAENCRRSAATKLTSEGAEEIRRRYSRPCVCGVAYLV